YNAAVHLDEKGHPHAHFNVIPLATGYKKGLSIQPSFKRALQNEGYLDKGRSQLKSFKNGEVQVLEGMLQTLGIERKLVGTNDIKDMREYKQMIQEVNAEKERLMSDIAVERSNLLSKQRELEGNIKHLYQVKNAREGEIGALN
ncbi:plasmid recombination protein, partial [Streptococcus suis]